MGLRSSISGTRRQASVADAAAEWFATLQDPECTPGEREQFADWLRRSNLHVEEFLRISIFARQLGEPSLWGKESIEDLVAQALNYQNGHQNGLAAIAPRQSTKGGSRSMRWLLPLAAAALIAAVTVAINPQLFDGSGATYATAVGEQRSIALEDGSVVELNTQSSLRTRFTESDRSVDLLRGEAIFRVAKNPHRPFRVFSGSTEIMAVGTAFNVYARDSGTVVTVIEGRVRVTRTDAATDAAHLRDMELSRGEQAVIMPKRPMVRVALTDPNRATAWTQRRLIFEDMPLSAVTAEFARYYNARTIRIADPGIADLHITGVFDASDPASLVQFLGAFGDIEIREDEHGWTLLGSRSRAPAAEIVAK